MARFQGTPFLSHPFHNATTPTCVSTLSDHKTKAPATPIAAAAIHFVPPSTRPALPSTTTVKEGLALALELLEVVVVAVVTTGTVFSTLGCCMGGAVVVGCMDGRGEGTTDVGNGDGDAGGGVVREMLGRRVRVKEGLLLLIVVVWFVVVRLR